MLPPQPLHVDPALAAIVRPGAVWIDDVRVAETSAAIDALTPVVVTRVTTAPPAETDAVRAMYRRVGLDPTKTRPSNEALLRRVRRGDPFPRVNALVDAVNLCSLEWQLPYGVYDRASLTGPIALRLGVDGEAYAGIRKDVVHVEGRLTLADADGPFGNPTSDSARAMVTAATTHALVVIYAPVSAAPTLADVVARTATRVLDVVGGRDALRWCA